MALQISQYFTGLSTDRKPVPSGGNGLFYETDTGRRFHWDGGVWQLEHDPGTAHLLVLERINSNLERLVVLADRN